MRRPRASGAPRSATSRPTCRPPGPPVSRPRKRRRSTATCRDAVWAKAQVIDEFYQLDPDTGQPVSERTELRILYDTENLYVAIYAYDREPDLISATHEDRDGNLGVDDSVRIYLDPLNTRRNAYFFEMNALGGRIDELIQNNTDFFREWNTIWSGSSRIVDDGWTVEMAIPFRNFSFDPAQPDWVFEFLRDDRARTNASAGARSPPPNGPPTSRAPAR